MKFFITILAVSLLIACGERKGLNDEPIAISATEMLSQQAMSVSSSSSIDIAVLSSRDAMSSQQVIRASSSTSIQAINLSPSSVEYTKDGVPASFQIENMSDSLLEVESISTTVNPQCTTQRFSYEIQTPSMSYGLKHGNQALTDFNYEYKGHIVVQPNSKLNLTIVIDPIGFKTVHEVLHQNITLVIYFHSNQGDFSLTAFGLGFQ